MAQKRTTATGKTRWVGRHRDPAGKDRSKTFDTKRDAVAWENEKRRDIRHGDWVDPDESRITLRTLAEEAAELAPEPDTRTQHRYYASQLGELGDYPIGRVKRADLQRWINQLSEGRPWAGGKPLQPATVRGLGIWTNGLLKQAKRERRIKDNPAENVILPDPADAVRISDIPTVDQVNELIRLAYSGILYDPPKTKTHPWEVAPHPTFARFVGVMAGTGMRPSELAGLRWQDVSLEKMVIDVTVQASRDGKTVKTPKTAQGRRVVPFGLDVATLLREQRDQGIEGPDGTIFGTARGARFTAVVLSSIYRKYRAAAGMDGLRLYSLRHFYASRLIASGVSVKAVSVVMGHKDPAITLQVYTHLWPGDLDVVRQAGSGFLRDSCGIVVPGRVDNVLELRGQTA